MALNMSKLFHVWSFLNIKMARSESIVNDSCSFRMDVIQWCYNVKFYALKTTRRFDKNVVLIFSLGLN